MNTTQRAAAGLLASAALALAGCASPGYQQGQGYYPPQGYPTGGGAYPQYGQVVDMRFLGGGSSGVAGAAVGGVVGGVVGHQFGGGTGNTAATILGAVDGALVGNAIERNANREQGVYRVTVQMQNGAMRTFDYGSPPNVGMGDRVRVDGNQLYREY